MKNLLQSFVPLFTFFGFWASVNFAYNIVVGYLSDPTGILADPFAVALPVGIVTGLAALAVTVYTFKASA